VSIFAQTHRVLFVKGIYRETREMREIELPHLQEDQFNRNRDQCGVRCVNFMLKKILENKKFFFNKYCDLKVGKIMKYECFFMLFLTNIPSNHAEIFAKLRISSKYC